MRAWCAPALALPGDQPYDARCVSWWRRRKLPLQKATDRRRLSHTYNAHHHPIAPAPFPIGCESSRAARLGENPHNVVCCGRHPLLSQVTAHPWEAEVVVKPPPPRGPRTPDRHAPRNALDNQNAHSRRSGDRFRSRQLTRVSQGQWPTERHLSSPRLYPKLVQHAKVFSGISTKSLK